MAKLNLSGKGKKAFKRLKTINTELGEINNILGTASTKLKKIIDNNMNISAQFQADSYLLNKTKPKQLCMIEGAQKRIDFKLKWLQFYIDFTIIASEHDDLVDINGSIIYGTSRTLCFSNCPANNKDQCQRTTRCDGLEDKPLIQFSVNRQGIIHSSGELEDKWWLSDDEDLLDLHFRALDLIWKKALDWSNENILT